MESAAVTSDVDATGSSLDDAQGMSTCMKDTTWLDLMMAWCFQTRKLEDIVVIAGAATMLNRAAGCG